MTSPELPVIVVVDLETSSNVTGTCGVCQVGAVAMVPGEHTMLIQPLLEMFCKPSEPVTPEALDVHGISPDFYVHAPDDVVALWVLEQAVLGLQREVVFAGYNSAKFDMPIIKRLLPSKTWSKFEDVDAMRLAIRRDSGQSYKLIDTFAQECGDEAGAGDLIAGAHGAIADCHMVARLLRKWMLQRNTTDAGALVKELADPVDLKLMPHGKYRGVPFKDVPASYLTWAADNWTDAVPDIIYTFSKMGLLRG